RFCYPECWRQNRSGRGKQIAPFQRFQAVRSRVVFSSSCPYPCFTARSPTVTTSPIAIAHDFACFMFLPLEISGLRLPIVIYYPRFARSVSGLQLYAEAEAL